jgi:hypothetical protein
MATTSVHADGLVEALDLGFSVRDYWDDTSAELTTDHPSSSGGLPVLVKDGQVYAPADLPGVTLTLCATSAADAELIGPACAAGWPVTVTAYCDWCGEKLSNAATRKPGDLHAICTPRDDRQGTPADVWMPS